MQFARGVSLAIGMLRMRAEEWVRAEAAALGFSSCGFAAARPIARDAFLDGWLAAGFAGSMRYLERHPERRLTVAGILPTARTVISLAYPYTPPPPPARDWRRTLRGRKITLYNDTVIGYAKDGTKIIETPVEEPLHIRPDKHANSI